MTRVPSLPLLRTQSDERLVRLARQGHERAFEAIVERYRKPLHRQCRRVLSEARAEDAVQQAFLAAWTGLSRGDEVRELRPWLHRIARNAALNVARAPGFDYDELRDSLRLTDTPQDDLERRAVMRQTLAGIAALPGRQREALLRTAVRGHGQDAIARDLGLSSGAVRQLVHRARETLRAAATAITPLPVAAWLVAAGARSEPMAQRVAELAAGGASVSAAATVAKAGAVAVVLGGAITGPAMLDDHEPRSPATLESAGDRAPRPAGIRSPARASAMLPVPPAGGSVRRNAGAAAVQAGNGGRSEEIRLGADREHQQEEGGGHQRERGEQGDRGDRRGDRDGEREDAGGNEEASYGSGGGDDSGESEHEAAPGGAEDGGREHRGEQELTAGENGANPVSAPRSPATTPEVRASRPQPAIEEDSGESEESGE